MVVPANGISNHWLNAVQNKEVDLLGEEIDDMSEEEDMKKTNIKRSEEMRCTQSLQDTEALEHFNEYKTSNGFKPSAFKSSPGRGFANHNVEREEESISSAPFWFKGQGSTHCSRGCCGVTRQATQRSSLIGEECVEDEPTFPLMKEDPILYSGSRGVEWRSHGTVNPQVVESMIISVLRQKGCLGSGSSLSNMIQDVLAKEITERTTQIVQVLQANP